MNSFYEINYMCKSFPHEASQMKLQGITGNTENELELLGEV